jgi:5,5'-dehydrodivanillate O-demethylase oxygenase subunit
MNEREKNRAAQLKLLTQTGPETPMGKLLRQFWHPVATSAHLASGTARKLRVMCEDLTLYRGESGTPYLVGGRCAHRCTVLHTGWVQNDQIRCMYHGWRYDGAGLCTEMPAEKNAKPGLVRIASYPVYEYCGLIFAYMGEAPAPPFELPRKDALEEPGIDISTREDLWDCNWLQQAENSLDATHLSFVHQWPAATRLGEEIGGAIPELDYEETAAGIRQTAVRPNSVRISNWTFPNNNNVLAAPPRPGDPWIHTVGWAVPVDDEHTLRFALFAYPGGEVGAELRRNGAIMTGRATDYTHELFEEHRLPDVGAADRIMAQDYAAVRGQGVVYDRSQGQLGASDAGIALLRRIIFRELEAIRRGQPTKHWKKIDAPVEMQRLA